jgi:LmbE family N-acetylglucosaminyl deacetylase
MDKPAVPGAPAAAGSPASAEPAVPEPDQPDSFAVPEPAHRDSPAVAEPGHRLTLMTVHAHPDDEMIGTGGSMAKAVAAGHRVVLVTCTRGEMGEIVVPEMDTPENHRRLGEIRAAELEAAVGELGLTEWENLGYHDSDMMGRPGNLDPRSFWQADLDEAIGRLVWLVRRYQPDVMTTYNDFGGYGHPDHIRTHLVAVGAFERAGDPDQYRRQLASDLGGDGPALAEGGLAPWAPSKLYEQASPASMRRRMSEIITARGMTSAWGPAPDATPEQIAEFEARFARMTVPDEAVTTWIDVAPWLDARWRGLQHHVTQISATGPFSAIGLDGWRELGGKETFILRESRVPATRPESDLFDGLT